MESEEGGGDEIEVVDFVRREGSEPFREILGESKVWFYLEALQEATY